MRVGLHALQEQLRRHFAGKNSGKTAVQIAQRVFVSAGDFRRDRQAAAVGNGFVGDESSIFI